MLQLPRPRMSQSERSIGKQSPRMGRHGHERKVPTVDLEDAMEELQFSPARLGHTGEECKLGRYFGTDEIEWMQNEARRRISHLASNQASLEVSQRDALSPPADVMEVAEMEGNLQDGKGGYRYLEKTLAFAETPTVRLDGSKPVAKLPKQGAPLGPFFPLQP